jgi:conjugal transfer/entry exclusion protein
VAARAPRTRLRLQLRQTHNDLLALQEAQDLQEQQVIQRVERAVALPRQIRGRTIV